jgi:hypothetical protein
MTTRRKWYIFTSLLFTSSAFGASVYIRLDAEPERAYNRLKLGMEESDVEDVIGRPPNTDDSFSPSCIYGLKTTGTLAASSIIDSRFDIWIYSDCSLRVCYDDADKVTGFCIMYHRQPFFDRLKAYIGW